MNLFQERQEAIRKEHEALLARNNKALFSTNGIFNRLFATATTLFTVEDDGEEFPKLLPQGGTFLVENIFADFKRNEIFANRGDLTQQTSGCDDFLTFL